MATSNGAFLHGDPAASPAQATLLPPWLSDSHGSPVIRPPSPSVTLSLASSTVAAAPSPISWLQQQTESGASLVVGNLPSSQAAAAAAVPGCGENLVVSELVECCRELDEGHRSWAVHKKEAAWRLRRVELQLEAEKACRRREKMEEVDTKVKVLREEQQAALERIEAEYREQLVGLRRDAEAKEQKLAEQWAAKHARLTKFLEQMGYRQPRIVEPNNR